MPGAASLIGEIMMTAAEAFGSRAGAGRKAILVVDGEAGIRDFLKVYLSSKSFDVLTAANAFEVDQLLRDSPPALDLLLVEILLPGKDGIEVAKSLAAAVPDLKVVLMSSHRPDWVRDSPFADAPFLQKPFPPADLLKILRQTLL